AHAESCGLIGGGDVQGALGTAEAALAVRDHREQIGAPGDALRGAQLPRGGAVVTRAIGDHAVGLAHDADTATEACRETGVVLRGLVVDVLECEGGDHVPAHALCGLLAEAAQLVLRLLVELATRYALGHAGLERTLSSCFLAGPSGADRLGVVGPAVDQTVVLLPIIALLVAALTTIIAALVATVTTIIAT